MPSGLGAKLPLVIDENDGPYKLLKTFQEMVKQNFKMLMLTAPGERIMDIHFGVGLRNYLFENNTNDTYDDISIKSHEQVARYMPYVRIDDIEFIGPEQTTAENNYDNYLSVRYYYTILPLDLPDTLEIS